MRALVVLTCLGSAGCFVDAVGLGGAGGSDATTGATTGASPTTTATGASTSQTAGVASGGGGAGGSAGCVVDGEIGGGEACEDGNLVPGDGCDQNCQLEATCGNGVPEGGEPCDDGTVCDTACLGACMTAEPLAAGATVAGDTTAGAIAPFATCSSDAPGNMRVYSVTLPPHPEGIVALAWNNRSDFDPILWTARDCSMVTACDYDYSSTGVTAWIRTPIMPPSSRLLLGVADLLGEDTSFKIYYRPYRYADYFTVDPVGWTLSGWDSNGDELNTWNDPAGSEAVSPPVYVGGISTIRISFPYRISSLAGAEVGVAFDGGAFTLAKTLPPAPTFSELDGTFEIARPDGAATMQIRFVYLGTSEGVLIDWLEIGPAVPAPM